MLITISSTAIQTINPDINTYFSEYTRKSVGIPGEKAIKVDGDYIR